MKRVVSLLLVIALVLGCTCTSMAATTKSVNGDPVIDIWAASFYKI